MYALYRPLAEMFASVICSLPQKGLGSFLFHIPLYFMTNLRRGAAPFFIYWLFMFVTLITMSMLFRTIGSLSSRSDQSLAPISILTLVSIIYTGFAVPPNYMVSWLGWIRWVNPVSYTYESLMINEVCWAGFKKSDAKANDAQFQNRNLSCTSMVPAGLDYEQLPLQDKICAVIGAIPGEQYIQGSNYLRLKFGYVPSHLWR
jgi:ABC-type multidrug transport system permease subunit